MPREVSGYEYGKIRESSVAATASNGINVVENASGAYLNAIRISLRKGNRQQTRHRLDWKHVRF